jgi:hypothetical protein
MEDAVAAVAVLLQDSRLAPGLRPLINSQPASQPAFFSNSRWSN